MYRLILLAAFLQCCISQQYQQKPPPGVPPQNYQNYQQPPPPPPPQMQQQPPPQQYQQQQYQQPPQQQYQQQVPVQQVPIQQQVPQGGQPARHGDPQLLNPANIKDEREHIQEHMDVPIDTSKMSEHELQFHYFKMHDADNNNKLDGCELIKSLIHWHEDAPDVVRAYPDEDLVAIIDSTMQMTDVDEDGWITYPEYFVRMTEKPLRTVVLSDGDKKNKDVEDESNLEIMVDASMKKADLDLDGMITYAEYQVWVRKPVGIVELPNGSKYHV